MSSFRAVVENYLERSAANSDSLRAAAYERLRGALRSQLTKTGLSPEDIASTAQMRQLNAAIGEIEAERSAHGSVPAPVGPPVATAPKVAAGSTPVLDRPSAVKSEAKRGLSWLNKSIAALCLLAIGGFGHWALFSRASEAPATRAATSEIERTIAAARDSFKLNRALVDSIATRLEAYRTERGRLPTTGGLIAWSRFVTDNPALSGLRTAPFNRGSLIVQTDGENYKILVVQSGDCVAALLDAKDYVDTPRSGGNLDCVYYGRWTQGGRAW